MTSPIVAFGSEPVGLGGLVWRRRRRQAARRRRRGLIVDTSAIHALANCVGTVLRYIAWKRTPPKLSSHTMLRAEIARGIPEKPDAWKQQSHVHRFFSPGDVPLCDDLTGKEHATRAMTDMTVAFVNRTTS